MIYTNIKDVKDDFDWLVEKCHLEQFVLNKLDEYNKDILKKQLIEDCTDSFILKFFENLLIKYDLEDIKWQKQENVLDFPMLVLSPKFGMGIIIEKDESGDYKVLSKNGIEAYSSFSKGSYFKPLKLKVQEKEESSSKSMFKKIAFKQKKYFFYAIVATISVNILALTSSFYTMQVYDRVIPTNGISTLISLSIGVTIAILLEMILKISRASIVDQVSKNMDIEYSHNIFSRFLSIRMDEFPNSVGSLSSKLSSYSSVRSFIVSSSLFIFIDFPFSFLFLFVIILLGGLKLGGVILFFMFISIMVGLIYKSKIEKLTKQSSMASHKKLGLLVESIENASKIKSSNARWNLLSKWTNLSNESMDDELNIKHSTDIVSFLTTFFQQISYVSLVAIGAYVIATDTTITMGSLIAITILSNKVFVPTTQIPNLFVQWGRAKISIEDLDSIYSLAKDNEEIKRPITAKLQGFDIKCEKIKFEYIKDKPILNIPNLEIKQGEKIAILGVIGSGKSTLLKLLSGLYKPTKGRVYLNNLDLNHISRANISDAIGYLAQDTKLFSGTLRDNLTFGMINIEDDEILKAANLTGLIKLISFLPNGLDTQVPEGGDSVSGGQKQLIALTRMIIAKNKILLLDEPTANFDESTEKHLLKVLKTHIEKTQTMIIVTHKPAILDLVDRIIILNNDGLVVDDKKEVVLKQLAINTLKQKNKRID